MYASLGLNELRHMEHEKQNFKNNPTLPSVAVLVEIFVSFKHYTQSDVVYMACGT